MLCRPRIIDAAFGFAYRAIRKALQPKDGDQSLQSGPAIAEAPAEIDHPAVLEDAEAGTSGGEEGDRRERCDAAGPLKGVVLRPAA
jgi:hypothetical protein